jgi:molybdopterin-guanine dinucleotide biosynthesis protein A
MGTPKAWLPFGNELMLARVVRLLGQAVGPVVVVAAPDQNLPPLPDSVCVVRDPVAGRGPLQGLAAGLCALPDDAEVAYVTGTDVPFLEPAWIGRLAALIGDHALAIPSVAGKLQPLAALYRRSAILPIAHTLLEADRLSLLSLCDLVRVRIITDEELRPVDPGLRTVFNVNSPADYQSALRDAGLA